MFSEGDPQKLRCFGHRALFACLLGDWFRSLFSGREPFGAPLAKSLEMHFDRYLRDARHFGLPLTDLRKSLLIVIYGN